MCAMKSADLCTEPAVWDTIGYKFSLPRCLAAAVRSLSSLGQFSISVIPSGKLSVIFHSHVAFAVVELTFSLEKAPPPFLKIPSVSAYLLL